MKARLRGFSQAIARPIVTLWNGSLENNLMVNRRSVMVGSLAMAAAPSLARIAQAQSGKPMLVFVGHEL